MTSVSIEKQIIEFLRPHMPQGATPSLETRILDDTTMDSVKVMDFLLELEDELDITISLNQLANVETAKDLIKVVQTIYENAKA